MVKAIRVFVAMMSIAFAGAACATFPDKPIRLYVGFPPGGGGDTYGRLIGQAMGDYLKQPVVVHNQAGAGGAIAADRVAKSDPDGYTLLLAMSGNIAVLTATTPEKLAYKLSDFAPVGLILEAPMGLFVPVDSRFNTAQELFAAAKERSLTYGVTGIAGAGQLAMEMANAGAGVEQVSISYRGAGPAVTDLMGGRIDSFFTVASPLVSHVRQNTLRLLAISGDKRNPTLPEVPTFKEVGADVPMTQWYGLMAPAGTPKAALDKLGEALTYALQKPEVVEFIRRDAATERDLQGNDFMQYVEKDVERYKSVYTPEMRERLGG